MTAIDDRTTRLTAIPPTTAGPAPMMATATATAATYLRVSTREQAERDGEPEGYSLPAQREANRRKAEALGATIVEEFAERGASGTKAESRPELQRLLRYLQEHHVDYVIVHKVDRLARNRLDDAQIHVAIKEAGAELVSATENIDETPAACWCTAS
ncbi:recombinase family protein [Skermania piniformis]|uniref:Recombinase family protein n=1 Tax=Skermania pinensis TaxID=39122 RepID=A0ABX8S6H8_9ACTN|nr:recombinase family protein [Skermania piniformis]QXQ13432.1 recombinase family protein [Skermania piniformis]